jgi:tetratricopeptide (TPR) repeat protein
VAYEIPAAIPHFADRDPERARAFRAVDEWRDQFRPLWIVLSGIAGIGKTELAYEVARGRRLRFPDGVLYIDLDNFRRHGAVDSVETVEFLLRRLGAAAEWPEDPSVDCHQRYRTKTEDSELEIVIDNARFESEVIPLLPASGASVVIVTSHAPLADLEAGVAVEIPLAPLDEGDAVELLVRAAGDRRLTTDSEAARELAWLCGGLPLAIHVAARFIRRHPRRSLPVLLDAFRKALHEKGLPEVEKVWDAAYESLGPGAARLYRLLADVPGSTFTEYSAAAMLGCGPDDAATGLEELDTAGLTVNVRDDFGNERVQLHAPLRAHARRRAQRHGDREELAGAQRRIVSWYLRQAQLADERAAGSRLTLAPRISQLPDVADAPIADAYQWLEAERHALHECVALAYARGLDTEAWSLCEPLFTHYHDHPHYADAVEAFGTGLAAAQRAGHVPAVVRMRSQLAFLYRDQGRFDEARHELVQALTASRLLGNSGRDRKLRASVTEFRGRLREDEGQLAEAAADYEDALHVHEVIRNDYGVMLLSYRLGRAVAKLGEPGRAAELLERAHLMAGQDQRKRMTARTGSALADVLRGLGQAERARRLYLESLDSARARHSDFDEARVLDALASLADQAGDTAAGLEYRAAASTIRERNGVRA